MQNARDNEMEWTFSIFPVTGKTRKGFRSGDEVYEQPNTARQGSGHIARHIWQ